MLRVPGANEIVWPGDKVWPLTCAVPLTPVMLWSVTPVPVVLRVAFTPSPVWAVATATCGRGLQTGAGVAVGVAVRVGVSVNAGVSILVGV